MSKKINFLFRKHESAIRTLPASDIDHVGGLVSVRPSTIDGAGRGLFATARIDAKCAFATYGGELVRASEVKKAKRSAYLLATGSEWLIEGDPSVVGDGHLGAFVNHSKEPNAFVEIGDTDDGVPYGRFVARRAIAEGEEIFIDYGAAYWRDLPPPKPDRPTMKRKRVLGEGGGTDGHPTLLKDERPVPAFDLRVKFYEFVAVVTGTFARLLHIRVDQDNGAVLDNDLPPYAEVVNHKYWVDDELTLSSMTTWSGSFISTFDGNAQSWKMATGTRLFDDPSYDYYQAGRPAVERAWPLARYTALRDFCQKNRILLPEHEQNRALSPFLGMFYRANAHERQSLDYQAFRSVHDPIVQQELLKMWDARRNEGSEFHKCAELYYNDCYDPSKPGFQSKEFGHFLQYVNTWVKDHGLVMWRTEISMCYFGGEPDCERPAKQNPLCGTIDAMFVYKSDVEAWLAGKAPKPTRCVLIDWKRCKKIETGSFGRNARGPFRDMPSTNYTKYQVQLNCYRETLERYTSWRVTDMFIVNFHPNYDSYQVFEVKNLRAKVQEMFRMRQRGVDPLSVP